MRRSLADLADESTPFFPEEALEWFQNKDKNKLTPHEIEVLLTVGVKESKPKAINKRNREFQKKMK